jgi:DNA repair exonuclease SbcCD ATPase subunit
MWKDEIKETINEAITQLQNLLSNEDESVPEEQVAASQKILESLLNTLTQMTSQDKEQDNQDNQTNENEEEKSKQENTTEKRDYSNDKREEMADTGEALPDGSFPIRNKQDLLNAIKSYGRAKNPEEAKAHIIKRAEALAATDLLPEDWKTSEKCNTKEVEKTTKPEIDKLEKQLEETTKMLKATQAKLEDVMKAVKPPGTPITKGEQTMKTEQVEDEVAKALLAIREKANGNPAIEQMEITNYIMKNTLKGRR